MWEGIAESRGRMASKRMAKDVERALIDITATHGARSTNEAVQFVAELKKSGRYQTDVY